MQLLQMPDKAVDTRLQTVLSDWQRWPISAKPRFLKTFTAGLNHQTHLVESAGTNLVLKLFTSNHQAAIEAQRWASGLGIAPAVHYADPNFSYALFAYLGASTLTADRISKPMLRSLAAALTTMHAAEARNFGQLDAENSGDFKLLGYYEQYLHTITGQAPYTAKIHQQLMPALTIFVQDPTPWCICHNDLVAENCFIVDGEAQFIDWEYAQRHNPWFDLAAIILYLDLDLEQATVFLRDYQDGWQELAGTPIYYASQCALLWGDMLWHLARGISGSSQMMMRKYDTLKHLATRLSISL